MKRTCTSNLKYYRLNEYNIVGNEVKQMFKGSYFADTLDKIANRLELPSYRSEISAGRYICATVAILQDGTEIEETPIGVSHFILEDRKTLRSLNQ